MRIYVELIVLWLYLSRYELVVWITCCLLLNIFLLLIIPMSVYLHESIFLLNILIIKCINKLNYVSNTVIISNVSHAYVKDLSHLFQYFSTLIFDLIYSIFCNIFEFCDKFILDLIKAIYIYIYLNHIKRFKNILDIFRKRYVSCSLYVIQT